MKKRKYYLHLTGSEHHFIGTVKSYAQIHLQTLAE